MWETHMPEPFLKEYCEEKRGLEDTLSRILSEYPRMLVKHVRDHRRLFVYLEGSLDASSMVFLVEEKETVLDRKLLVDFFHQRDFTSFYVYRSERNFQCLMDIITAHSNSSYELVVYYTGHGSAKGLELDDVGSIIEPGELMICLQRFPGKAILLLNACHSGDIAQRLVYEDARFAVVSASKPGEKLSRSAINEPGYFVQDLMRSHMDLEEFERICRSRPDKGYAPRVYWPAR